MRWLSDTLELARLGSSLLIFAMVFVPLAVRSHDPISSFGRALPMLLISMCAFIANDLDDIEADRKNHPERPLPSKRISPVVAAIVYFACLASALVLIKVYITPRAAFLYYLTVTLTISYHYIVAFVPSIKSAYAAGTIAIPAIIVATYGHDARLYIVAFAIFLFNLGRELCMDVVDRAGDTKSLLHRLSPNDVGVCAFVLQATSLVFIMRSLALADMWALVDFSAVAMLLLVAGIYWFRLRRYAATTDVMKLQLLLGIYFLI